jgi:acetyl esterase/lipase
MKKIAALFFMYLVSTNPSPAQVSIPLYETIPNSKPAVNKEKSDTADGIQRITHVSIPTLTIYRPTVNYANATAVVICPGGGYGMVAAGHEGSDIAKVFNEWGIVAFVVKYRLPDEAIMIDKTIGPLQDAQRAIQLVRQNAATWNVDAGKIGIMGFSAGGHLASTASTHFDKPVIDNPGNISLRPDFSILVYPVISFTDSIAHKGSRNNLIGKNPSAEKIKEYSNELQVTAKTPPAFLVHAKDDNGVKFENSVRYYEALIKNKVPAELRLYDHGGHGFGLNNPTTTDKWMERLKTWLRTNRYF